MVLQQYSQIVHDDDKHTGSAKRDTANGVAGIDASKQMINDVPFSLLVDMDKQSFTNLLKNGDFESWSVGASNATPDGWNKTGTGTFDRESTEKIFRLYSAKVTYTAAVALYQQLSNYADFKEQTVSGAIWVKSSVASQARLRINDGIGSVDSSHHTGGGGWELLTASKTISASATKLTFELALDTAGIAYFDGAILVEGSVCPAFSPKPLFDDCKTLQIDSNTNTVSVGGKLVMTCTPQILTGAGAISVDTCITHLVTGGVGADAITLADGVEGQEKIILIKTLTAGGDTSVVTPANFAHGTTFTGTQAGSIQNLIFTNGSWHWTGGRNTTIA